MLDRAVVRTGIPGWFIRFDDNREELAIDIRHFLERGLHCALAINANTVGTLGRMSWADMR